MTNDLFLGKPLPDWKPVPRPLVEKLKGQYCDLEALSSEKHCDDLWSVLSTNQAESVWHFLPYGPFANKDELAELIESKTNDSGELFFAVMVNNKAIGWIAYARIQEAIGSIEVAHVCFSPQLQKTTAATEAIYLLMEHCFSVGYRRCEWKCNSLNAGSKKAAVRLGFQYEGCFRQATVVKGRSRDTDWYSVIDNEWSLLQKAFQDWLSPNNFDAQGIQKQSLLSYQKP